MIFAVADLLSADAVVVLDPDVTSVTPDWIPALVRPVRDGACRLRGAAAIPARRPTAPLVTQLVRPLVRAAYGWTLHEPLMGEFGCSRRFASALPRASGVGHRRSRPTAWTCGWPAEALAKRLPSRRRRRSGRACSGRARKRPALPDVFQQVMDAVCACLELHDSYWLPRGAGRAGAVLRHPDAARWTRPASRRGRHGRGVRARRGGAASGAGDDSQRADAGRRDPGGGHARRGSSTTTTCGPPRCSSSCSRITAR